MTGPTGCGKSTCVPKLLSELNPRGRVICTQPRRLAVVAVATRVAAEMGVLIGGDRVGYSIGGDSSFGHEAEPPALHFVTAGFMLQVPGCWRSLASPCTRVQIWDKNRRVRPAIASPPSTSPLSPAFPAYDSHRRSSLVAPVPWLVWTQW